MGDILEYFECLNGNKNVPSSVAGVSGILKLYRYIFICISIIIPIKNLLLLGRSVFRCLFSKRIDLKNELVAISILGRDADVYYSKKFRSSFNLTFVYLSGGASCVGNHQHCLIETFLPRRFLPLLLLEAVIFSQFALVSILLRKYIYRANYKVPALELFNAVASGEVFYGKILDRAMDRLANTASVSTILLPIEGRNWERRATRIIKRNGCHCLGYTPAIFTSCHGLATADSFREATEFQYLDLLLVPGKYNFRVLRHAGWPESKLFISGYLRDICKTSFGGHTSQNSGRILIVLSGNYLTDCVVINKIQSISSDFEIDFKINHRVASSKYLSNTLKNLGLAVAKPEGEYDLIISKSATYFAEVFTHDAESKLIFLKTSDDYCPNFLEVDASFKDSGIQQLDIEDLSSLTVTKLMISNNFISATLEKDYFFARSTSFLEINQMLNNYCKELPF